MASIPYNNETILIVYHLFQSTILFEKAVESI